MADEKSASLLSNIEKTEIKKVVDTLLLQFTEEYKNIISVIKSEITKEIQKDLTQPK